MSNGPPLTIVVGGYSAPSGDRVSPRPVFASGTKPGRVYVPSEGDVASVEFAGGYSPPSGDAVGAVLPLASGQRPIQPYIPPEGDATTASFSPWKNYPIPSPPITITLPPSGRVFGSAAGSITFSASAAGSHGVGGVAGRVLGISASAYGETENIIHQGTSHGVVQLIASASGAHGVGGAAEGTLSLGLSGSASAAHGVGGAAHATLKLWASAVGAHGVGGAAHVVLRIGGNCEAQHTRFEVRGMVRETEEGVLLTRRVRAYSRATGELLSQADSVGGKFHVHCGLEPEEVVVMVIDLAPIAIDFRPPVTNRVMSVLARDSA